MSSFFDKYITKNDLNKKINNLEKEKKELRRQLDLLNKELSDSYIRKANIDNVLSIKIKMRDLLEELQIISGHSISNIEFYALYFFYDESKDINLINEQIQFFGNKLNIKFDNDDYISYWDYNFLTKLEDRQIDGKTLFDHCTKKTILPSRVYNCLAVDKNIEDIILNFNLNEIFINDYTNHDKDRLLEQAVYSCLEQGKVIEINRKQSKIKTKVRSCF